MKYTFIIALASWLLLEGCRKTKEQSYNQEAEVAGNGILPFDLLDANLISSGINTATQTMHTLYGNDIALQYARSKHNGQYPAGSMLIEVTWKQRPDPVWFGGNIPGILDRVELVEFSASHFGFTETIYKYYSGNPLKEAKTDTSYITKRVAQIAAERAAVMP